MKKILEDMIIKWHQCGYSDTNCFMQWRNNMQEKVFYQNREN